MAGIEQELPACPVEATIAVIGSKWKLLILKHLAENPRRFHELQRLLSGVSKKMLSESLKSLVDYGVVERTVVPSSPVQVIYALSSIGLSLQPVLAAMDAWGSRYKSLRLAGKTGS